jgi:ribosomal protein S18 acetylase RimI-like enzyme
VRQRTATIDIRLLGTSDAHVLDNVAPDVFDRPIDPRWTREFLADNRHHVVVALDGDLVVGFASAVHYVHPDNGPDLWINELGVAPTHQGRGIGRQVMAAILARGRALGCGEAWVGTEETNAAARKLYHSSGGVEDEDRFITYTFDLSGRESL